MLAYQISTENKAAMKILTSKLLSTALSSDVPRIVAEQKLCSNVPDSAEKNVTVKLHSSHNSNHFRTGDEIYAEGGHLARSESGRSLQVRGLTTFRDGHRNDTDLLELTFETTSLSETLLAALKSNLHLVPRSG